jgi:hypothetical protein
VIVTEHLVVVGVGKLVEHHRRLIEGPAEKS